MQKYLYLILGMAIGLSGCRTKKNMTAGKVQQTDSVITKTAADPLPKKMVRFTCNEWKSFSAKIAITYESEARSLPINTFGGQIRMVKDQFIWMSIQVPFLGEAGRALITKDSLKLIDRYNKKYLLTNFSYLQKYSSVPLSLEKLQAALIGNPTFELMDARLDSTETHLNARFEDAKICNTIQALLSDKRVQRNIYIDKLQNVDITATYHKFEEIEHQQIPNSMTFSTTKPEKNTADLEYNNVLLNKQVSPDFTIPQGYRKWNE